MFQEIINFFKHKCCFCRGLGDLSIIEHPGYHTTYHYFHDRCLYEIISEPEKNHTKIDTAIQIADRLKDKAVSAAEEIKRKKERLKQLKTFLYDDKLLPIPRPLPRSKSSIENKNRFELLKNPDPDVSDASSKLYRKLKGPQINSDIG